MAKQKPRMLTQLAVEKLRYTPGWGDPNEVPDHSRRQLRLVIQPSNARAFAVRTRINGKPAKIVLRDVGLDLAKARKATDALLEEIGKGHDPRAARRAARATNLGGVVELYLKDKASAVRPRTLAEIERHLRKRWAPLHAKPLAEIRKADVAARLLEIKTENGPVEANRCRSSLAAMLDWCDEQGLVEVNVAAATRKPHKGEQSRERVLSPDERRAIWAATADPGSYNAIVRLLLLTGQRREEIGGLRWSEFRPDYRYRVNEVDHKTPALDLPGARTKNKLPHLVPLSSPALDLIEAQKRKDGRDYLFGEGHGPYSGWSRAARRLTRKSGVLDAECYAVRRLGRALRPGEEPSAEDKRHGWTVHDLRRTVSTAMNEELGIAPHVVEAILNHVSGGAKRGPAGTYNRAQYLKERTRALQAWADHVTAAPVETVVELSARVA
jgi:integrase